MRIWFYLMTCSFTLMVIFLLPPVPTLFIRLRLGQEWKACVCVLVQGAAWQFKGWEWDQPVTLFQNGEFKKSLYLYMDFSLSVAISVGFFSAAELTRVCCLIRVIYIYIICNRGRFLFCSYCLKYPIVQITRIRRQRTSDFFPWYYIRYLRQHFYGSKPLIWIPLWLNVS